MRSEPAKTPYYFVPDMSPWPILGALALLVTMVGATAFVNDIPGGGTLNIVGIILFLFVLYKWFGDAIGESEAGLYSERIDLSYRWSMAWFIFSEVMFFAAFFGALFYARAIAMPWLADLDHKVLWPDFTAVAQWGNTGPAGVVERFDMMTLTLPTINTMLLLTSGVTLTIAHHALIADKRTKTAIWLFLTVLLGVIFMCCQIYEYVHAYTELNLKMTSGVYGSTFYMLTGFHGFHVTIGAIMLAVVLYRLLKGHFTPQQHFAFEGAAWYWHFVDVVWLGLYVVVYWL